MKNERASVWTCSLDAIETGRKRVVEIKMDEGKETTKERGGKRHDSL